MSNAPETWHYGLVAKWWAEFNQDGEEIAYFQKYVEQRQPALDVACGTGRLLGGSDSGAAANRTSRRWVASTRISNPAARSFSTTRTRTPRATRGCPGARTSV